MAMPDMPPPTNRVATERLQRQVAAIRPAVSMTDSGSAIALLDQPLARADQILDLDHAQLSPNSAS